VAKPSRPDAPTGRRIRGLDAAERRDERRRLLLDAALELFAAHSYQGTSIEQICQAAYVGTKSFYELFESREACYLALLQRITDGISARVSEVLADAPDDEAEATRLLVSAFAHALVDDPRRAKVTFGEAAGISPAVERQRRTNRRWAAGFVESVWDRYGATPRGGRVDSHRVAIGVVGGMFDLVADWLLDADPGDTGDVEQLVADLEAFYGVVRDGLRG
jgi:AcrR family transcriptional regulator